MADSPHGGHLGAVYGAATTEEVAARYDAWADTYDAEMAAAGYRHPAVCLAMLARHLPRGAAPLLDAGAGTGLIGDWLGIMGYPVVEGLDLSAGMLAVAARKGAYAKLHQAALGQVLPFETGRFAGILSAGVFTTGHVGSSALPELVRVCRPGGVMVLTVKITVWDGDVGPAVTAMAQKGAVAVIERTAPYVSMPGEAGTVPALCVALRIAPYALMARPSGS